MERRIFLKCLKKDSQVYYLVKLLKRCGGKERIELEKDIKKLSSVMHTLYPAVIFYRTPYSKYGITYLF